MGTRTLVQCLLALALVPIPCLEAGSPPPVLISNPGTGRLVQGAYLPVARIKPLDQCAPNHRPMAGLIPRLLQVTTRTIGIVMEIRPTSEPRASPDATGEGVMIAKERGTGIDQVRGGTPSLGIIRSLINYYPSGSEVTSTGLSGLNKRSSHSPRTFVLRFLILVCWRNNEKKL